MLGAPGAMTSRFPVGLLLRQEPDAFFLLLPFPSSTQRPGNGVGSVHKELWGRYPHPAPFGVPALNLREDSGGQSIWKLASLLLNWVHSFCATWGECGWGLCFFLAPHRARSDWGSRSPSRADHSVGHCVESGERCCQVRARSQKPGGARALGSRVGSLWAALELLHRSLTYFQAPFLF